MVRPCELIRCLQKLNRYGIIFLRSKDHGEVIRMADTEKLLRDREQRARKLQFLYGVFKNVPYHALNFWIEENDEFQMRVLSMLRKGAILSNEDLLDIMEDIYERMERITPTPKKNEFNFAWANRAIRKLSANIEAKTPTGV